jgi:tetratricopeptide (TPR) repeat protein
MMIFIASLFSLHLLSSIAYGAASSIEELHQAAVAAFRSNNTNQAVNFLKEAIEMDPRNPLLLNTAGVVLNSIGEVDRAADYFSTSLKHDPTGFNANYNAANLVHFTIFKNNPNFTILDSSIGYYKNAIDVMLKSNETDKSIAVEEQVSLLNDASIALMKRSRFTEAIELLQKVIEIDPNNVQALTNLALSYLDSGADMEQARQVSQMAIDRKPDDVELRRNHAYILRRMGLSLEDPGNDDVIFGMTFNYHNDISQQKYSINIELKRKDNPVLILNELQSKLGLDLLTYRWLHCNLHHALERLKEDLVHESSMVIDGIKLPSIKVHFGDDLYALARSYVHLHSLSSEMPDVIYEQLQAQVPQHLDLPWVNKRRSQLISLYPGGGVNENDLLSTSRLQLESTGICKTTLAIVTSGKLELFYNLVQKLSSSIEVCEVLVFDSFSPESSRTRMVSDFPQFNFVFIPEQDRGHAKTLNKMLKLAKSSYLLYLDDTWEPLGNADERIKRALLLMEAGMALRMPIAQVLMNEQSARSCALGISLTECRSNEFYGQAGWPRTVTVGNASFEYLEHEFGVQYLNHRSSSTWPGFSSRHPSLWNLNILTSRINSMFLEDNEAYDALFSIGVWEKGMTVAHLKDVGFRYIGQ